MLIVAAAVCIPVEGEAKIEFHYADRLEVVPTRDKQVWYVVGSVVFETESGWIYCDSAIWTRGERIKLQGKVIIDDDDYRLAADSVDYDLITHQAEARGSYIELWSHKDSIFAVGSHAFYDRDNEYYYMEERPTLFLNYPDTANMIEVIADHIYYDALGARTEASGGVKISSKDLLAQSGCAVMYPKRNVLDLFDHPIARRKQSKLTGQLISIISIDNVISRIDVIDSASAEFIEAVDTSGQAYDNSLLTGNRILFDFEDGELSLVTCYGQAYSWYYPYSKPGSETSENSVSGDTIKFSVLDEKLTEVSVVGGAVGTYLTRIVSVSDSTIDTTADTVDYRAHAVSYKLMDSVINLTKEAHVTSGEVALDAHLIGIDTRTDVLEAFSADIVSDTSQNDATLTMDVQPNPIPVILKDGDDILFGDYLEYSMATEKGRIIKSKSKYQTGYFYGEKVYREQKNIFYLDNSRYSTCDLDEPHFHFHSSNIKLVDNEKLIAKPVVLNIGRLPILALPYYVFPLKKGRHSGFLPFTFGNIERGERYIRNVGYYWAASEYWDWQGAVDYFEEGSQLNLNSKIKYNSRYHFNGSLSGSYGRSTGYSFASASETKTARWVVSGSHKHDISPSFRIDASGQFQSDASYYQDFSADLEDRLNRSLRSQINFSKRFGRSVSLSGKIAHDENLDTESRTDQLPSMALSLPTFHPFGSGTSGDDGQLETKWYQNLVARYSPNLLNFSQRITLDSVKNVVLDSLGLIESADTLSFRSRKEYARMNHSLTLSFPVRIAGYINLIPSFNYREEWFKVFKTDQSEAADLDASSTYRAYVYSTGASLSTDIYGTVYPNLLGLIGLRQVLTPTVSYRFTPEINRHPEIRSYAGGSAGSSRKSQSMTFSLKQSYQAKIKQREAERNLNLVLFTSSLSYDFEKDSLKFSNLNTSFQSTLLPRINFYGSIVHSLYKPGTDDLTFWSPIIQSFNVNASFTLAGSRFLFDEESVERLGPDTSLIRHTSGSGRGSKGWSLTANYSYRESGRESSFIKSSFFRLTLNFNLTPETNISYSQYYDVTRGHTVNNQVNIVRKLHCWTGSFFWVPVGSNRGWGFKLFVNALPQIKIDQSQNSLRSGYFGGVGR
jgi:lipopolysaccharide assembly outer membrane protein LptD (OstA)